MRGGRPLALRRATAPGAAIALGLAAACWAPALAAGVIPAPEARGGPRGVREVPGAPRFDRPVAIAFPAPDVALVVERGGRVRGLALRPGAPAPATFLDWRDRLDRLGSDDGLLGLALHPRFAQTGEAVVRYQLPFPRRTVLARLEVGQAGALPGFPASQDVLLEVPHGRQRRPGGLAFGPDGTLFVGLGDGSDAVAPPGIAQDPGALLGKILRLDVGVTGPDRPYGVPADALALGRGGRWREEVFAIGFRNPRHLGFDAGELWAVDSGGGVQEIDRVRPGDNHGWPVWAGDRCHRRRSCPATGFARPVATYDRAWGEAIVGGCIYRGRRFPALVGRYVYADAASGRIGVLGPGGGSPGRTLLETGIAYSAVERRPDGEPLFLSADGRVLELE